MARLVQSLINHSVQEGYPLHPGRALPEGVLDVAPRRRLYGGDVARGVLTDTQQRGDRAPFARQRNWRNQCNPKLDLHL